MAVTGDVVISPRLLNPLLMAGFAAALGAASGAFLDTEPLRWGSDLRDRLSPPETLAVDASQRHDTFEAAKGARLAGDIDYLAEDDVIYLPRIEASRGGELVLSLQDGHEVQADSRLPNVDQAGVSVESQQVQVDVTVGGVGAGEHRVAETLTGPGIIHFPTLTEGGG